VRRIDSPFGAPGLAACAALAIMTVAATLLLAVAAGAQQPAPPPPDSSAAPPLGTNPPANAATPQAGTPPPRLAPVSVPPRISKPGASWRLWTTYTVRPIPRRRPRVYKVRLRGVVECVGAGRVQLEVDRPFPFRFRPGRVVDRQTIPCSSPNESFELAWWAKRKPLPGRGRRLIVVLRVYSGAQIVPYVVLTEKRGRIRRPGSRPQASAAALFLDRFWGDTDCLGGPGNSGQVTTTVDPAATFGLARGQRVYWRTWLRVYQPSSGAIGWLPPHEWATHDIPRVFPSGTGTTYVGGDTYRAAGQTQPWINLPSNWYVRPAIEIYGAGWSYLPISDIWGGAKWFYPGWCYFPPFL
jgi:hypothetical protein